MITSLVLPEGLRAQIAREARDALPRECCGLIEGRIEDARATALAYHAATNLATGADRFEIDPVLHFRLLRGLRHSGRSVIGCYHSHPQGRPEPSVRDRAGACERGFVWLIIAAGAEPEISLGAFAWDGANFRALWIEEPAVA
jgi:proteasome lid subunit RPN8/RPN11